MSPILPARSRPSVGHLMSLALALLLLGACATTAASGPEPAGASPASPASTTTGAPTPRPFGSAATPPPPEEVHEWLTDDEGRRYFIDVIPKQGRRFDRQEDGSVRLIGGFVIGTADTPIEDEDEEAFYIRVYEVEEDRSAEAAPDPAVERAASEASYRFEARDSDRIRFIPFGEGLPTQGQWREGFALVDMNGDGHLDVVRAPERKGTRRPSILLGDSKGRWTAWEASFPRLPYDYGDVAVADFDSDGKPDIALAMHLTGTVVMVQRDNGQFVDWGKGLYHRGRPDSPPESAFTSRALVAVDWNADGRPDLVALGEGPAFTARAGSGEPAAASYDVVVYLNGGDGTWQQRRETPPRVTFGGDLEVADLDGDGRLDMLLAASVIGHSRILRLGRPDGLWDATELPQVRPRGIVGAVAVADFDGDGVQELLLGYQAHQLGAWRTGIDLVSRAGDQWERRPLFNEEGRAGVTALATGDLDNDERRDIVALAGDGRRWVLLGGRDGRFTLEKATELPVERGCRGYHVEVADLDGDGRDDVVEAFAGEPSAMWDPDRCSDNGGMGAWRSAAP